MAALAARMVAATAEKEGEGSPIDALLNTDGSEARLMSQEGRPKASPAVSAICAKAHRESTFHSWKTLTGCLILRFATGSDQRLERSPIQFR